MKLLSKGPWERRNRPDGSFCECRAVSYRAFFWEGPTEPGRTGKRIERDCQDTQFKDGRFLSTAPSVSYYSELAKACRA